MASISLTSHNVLADYQTTQGASASMSAIPVSAETDIRESQGPDLISSVDNNGANGPIQDNGQQDVSRAMLSARAGRQGDGGKQPAIEAGPAARTNPSDSSGTASPSYPAVTASPAADAKTAAPLNSAGYPPDFGYSAAAPTIGQMASGNPSATARPSALAAATSADSTNRTAPARPVAPASSAADANLIGATSSAVPANSPAQVNITGGDGQASSDASASSNGEANNQNNASSSQIAGSPGPPPAQTPTLQEAFIAQVAPSAQMTQQQTGVPASVTVAQAMLESDLGRSQLSKQANNFFGIKAVTKAGSAGVFYAKTLENVGGKNVTVTAPFRAYHNMVESFIDHAQYFLENARYALAMQNVGDPRIFARLIQQAGYATDPQYADKLISLMDKFNLYAYDIK